MTYRMCCTANLCNTLENLGEHLVVRNRVHKIANIGRAITRYDKKHLPLSQHSPKTNICASMSLSLACEGQDKDFHSGCQILQVKGKSINTKTMPSTIRRNFVVAGSD